MEEIESMAGSRPRRANDLGPIGEQLATNVKTLRSSLALTTEQLAERVAALGRPMRANTITKIEKGQRRVDADDLVTLAIALETRPDALLLPPTIAGEITLSEAKSVPALHAWQWANGKQPLERPADDDGRTYHAFQARAQPPGLGEYRFKPEELQPGIWHEGKFYPEPSQEA